jgi:hypothetical protein
MKENQETPNPQKSTSVEKHNYLISQLSDYHKRLVDFAFRHSTIIVIALGWIISSEQSQRLMQASFALRITITITVLFYCALYSFWVMRHHFNSETVYKQLVDLAYMESGFFELERIRRPFAYSFICLHFLVCLCLIAFIWLLSCIPNELLFQNS